MLFFLAGTLVCIDAELHTFTAPLLSESTLIGELLLSAEV